MFQFIAPQLTPITQLPTVPTVIAAIGFAVLSYVIGRMERLTDEVGMARYRQDRAAKQEAKRLRIAARNLARSTWPQFKALPANQRDQAGRQALVRVRYAGRKH